MKRLIISISILLTASLGLLAVFAEAAVDSSQLVPAPNQPTVSTKIDPNKTTTPEQQADIDPLADPNRIEAAIKAFEGLEKKLDELTRKNAGESRQWLRKESERLMPLAKANHQNIMNELMFIRKLAVEEGAAKTIAAIDGIMLSRQQQFDKLIEKYQQERREARREKTTRSRSQRSSQDRRTRSRTPKEENIW